MLQMNKRQDFGKGPFALRAQEVFIGMNDNYPDVGIAYSVVDAKGNEITPYLKAVDAKWIYNALTAAL